VSSRAEVATLPRYDSRHRPSVRHADAHIAVPMNPKTLLHSECKAMRSTVSPVSLAARSLALSVAAGIAAGLYARFVNGAGSGESVRFAFKFAAVVLAPMVAIVFATRRGRLDDQS